METRQQGLILFSAVLVLIATLVVIQLWLVAAALDALASRQLAVLVPTSVASTTLFALACGLLWYVVSFDERLRRQDRVADPTSRAPLVVQAPEVTRGLVARLRVSRLAARYGERYIWALFMFLNGFVTIAVLAGVAMVSRTPFVFPSLGPTAFLFFFTPRAPAASPRNTIVGHAIGILCGYAALWLFGLEHAPPAMATGVSAARVGASALSLALTGAVMILLKAAHPPAGATTLIISLGIVTQPFQLIVIEIAVAALTLQAIAINRLAGVDYPFWALRDSSAVRRD